MRLILSLVTAVGVVSGTAYATGCGQAVIARGNYGHANYSANYQANIYATPIIAAIVTPYVPTVTAALTAPVVPALTAPVAAVVAPQCNCPQAVVAQNYASPVVAAVVASNYGYGSALTVVAPVVHRRHNVVVRPIRANVVRQKVVVRRGLFRRR